MNPTAINSGSDYVAALKLQLEETAVQALSCLTSDAEFDAELVAKALSAACLLNDTTCSEEMSEVRGDLIRAAAVYPTHEDRLQKFLQFEFHHPKPWELAEREIAPLHQVLCISGLATLFAPESQQETEEHFASLEAVMAIHPVAFVRFASLAEEIAAEMEFAYDHPAAHFLRNLQDTPTLLEMQRPTAALQAAVANAFEAIDAESKQAQKETILDDIQSARNAFVQFLNEKKANFQVFAKQLESFLDENPLLADDGTTTNIYDYPQLVGMYGDGEWIAELQPKSASKVILRLSGEKATLPSTIRQNDKKRRAVESYETNENCYLRVFEIDLAPGGVFIETDDGNQWIDLYALS